MQKSTTIIGILEMLEDGFSYNDIRCRYSVGNSVITNIKKKYSILDIPLHELRSKDPTSIERLFYESRQRKNVPLPDFDKIYRKLVDKKSRSNLYYEWIEYKKEFPDGYQYTQFKYYFGKWSEENHLESDLRMLVERIPGEIVYLDWVGDTLDIVRTEDPTVLQTAHFFVATIGVSSRCFAMAFPDEKTDSFLVGTIKALEFYGGVPKILKPDNTKAVSIKNTKDELILNKVYEDIQEFYGTVIVPTPYRKPRGKASVENTVRWLETHLLERLKGYLFDNFVDLNEKIMEIIEELNSGEYDNKSGKAKEKGSRNEMFEKYDKPTLKALPQESMKAYKYMVKKVANNYHVEYDKHYYSVPYVYYKQEITRKVSFFDIIICDSMNREICRHERAYKVFPRYITKDEHMPQNHQYYQRENFYDGNAYKNWAKNYGDNVYTLICKVIGSFRHEEQSYRSCNGILQLCKDNARGIVDAAAKACLDAHIHNYSHFKNQLNAMMNSKAKQSGSIPSHKNIRGKSSYE